MKVYLSGSYARRAELVKYAQQLTDAGHLCTSRWLIGDADPRDDGLTTRGISHSEMVTIATMCVQDILRSHWMVCFTEPPGSPYSRGGRHVEAGMAIAAERRMISIGPIENVFYSTADFKRFETWDQFVAAEIKGGRR